MLSRNDIHWQILNKYFSLSILVDFYLMISPLLNKASEIQQFSFGTESCLHTSRFLKGIKEYLKSHLQGSLRRGSLANMNNDRTTFNLLSLSKLLSLRKTDCSELSTCLQRFSIMRKANLLKEIETYVMTEDATSWCLYHLPQVVSPGNWRCASLCDGAWSPKPVCTYVSNVTFVVIVIP